jgi:hypothetical protein
MAEVVFPKSFLGRKIEFTDSEWILDYKILERYVQVSEDLYLGTNLIPSPVVPGLFKSAETPMGPPRELS